MLNKINYKNCEFKFVTMCVSQVETRLNHLDYLGHILSGSTINSEYKLFGSDLDSVLTV